MASFPGERMVDIIPLDDDTTEATRAAVERIFFASAGRKTFADEAERSAFRERWLGRYLVHDRCHAFLARDKNDGIVGYLVGSLDDPVQTDRFRDISFYAGFADLTVRYPAHLHINLDPERRSQGSGGPPIEAFASHSSKRGAGGVHIVTGAGVRNVRFYEGCGFEGLRTNAWGDAQVLFMGRILGAR